MNLYTSHYSDRFRTIGRLLAPTAQNRKSATHRSAARGLNVWQPSVGTLICIVLLLSGLKGVHAQAYECVLAEDKRRISFDYPGRENLCEVAASYADGSRKVIWLANVNSQFCSDKLVELIGKYRNQWKWTCNAVVSNTELETLSQRERAFLDELVKGVVAQGRQASPSFKLRSVRAFSNETKTPSMVAQLLIGSSEGLLTDRIYLIKFDAESYRVEGIQIGLERLLVPPASAPGQAFVNQVYPDGSFSVLTTYKKNPEANDAPDLVCSGSAVLRSDGEGSLSVSTKPEFSCR